MIVRRIPAGTMALTSDRKQFATSEGSVHTQFKIGDRMRFWLGEWFADQRLGMPYREDILGQRTPDAVIRSIFWEALSECPGVNAVQTVDVSTNTVTRVSSVSWKVILDDGSVVSSEPFIIGDR